MNQTCLLLLTITKTIITAAISAKAPIAEPIPIGKFLSLGCSCFLSCLRTVALLLVVVVESKKKIKQVTGSPTKSA